MGKRQIEGSAGRPSTKPRRHAAKKPAPSGTFSTARSGKYSIAAHKSDVQSYHTFMIADLRTAGQLLQHPSPHSWRFSTHPDPSTRHWSSAEGRHKMQRRSSDYAVPSGLRPSLELLVEAEDPDTAENVASLVCAGTLLGHPDRIRHRPPPEPVAIEALSSVDLVEDEFFAGRFAHYDALLVGCRTAVEAWPDRQIVYALEKYIFSLELVSCNRS
jgi:hypothetical protein